MVDLNDCNAKYFIQKNRITVSQLTTNDKYHGLITVILNCRLLCGLTFCRLGLRTA